jgi:TolB-like protein
MSEPSKAVFLSYASQDAEAAQKICEALRAAGTEVFLDQSELRGGDAWDQKIRHEINDCALFIPMVSQHTQERLEGYFRHEWNLAIERTHHMAQQKPFLVPVVIDGTRDQEAFVPDAFKAVQWTHLPGGETPAAFVGRIKRLLSPELSPMSAASGATAAIREPVRATWLSKPVLLAIIAVVCLALAYFLADKFWTAHHATSETAAPASAAPTAFSPPPHSIAVLPFVNLSGDPKQEYFSDGITEELLNALSRLNELQVMARTSSFAFKGQNVDVTTIARKLNVSTILEGSVRQAGNTVRITVQLLNGKTGFHTWSRTYDRPLSDILKIQTQVATSVAQQLEVKLVGDETTDIATGGTASPEAYNLFLHGREILRTASTKSEYDIAVDYFRQSLKADNGFANGWLWLLLAQSAAVIDGVVTPQVVSEEMRHASDEVVALVPGTWAAHTAVAQIYWSLDWNWQAASTEYARAYERNPYSYLAARQLADVAHSILEDDTTALSLYRRAIDLDPLNYFNYLQIGNCYFEMGKLPEAESAVRESLGLDPKSAGSYAFLGLILIARGQSTEALAAIQREPDEGWRHWGLALAYQALGRKADADSELANIQRQEANVHSYRIAQIHAYRGEIDQSFAWLDRAYRQRDFDLTDLKRDSLLNNLRGDRRYETLLRKLGLSK